MTSSMITIQLTEDDARRLLASLRSTAMIAGDSTCPKQIS